ncbi:MAG: hypothetical protein KBT20_09065 [Bacteroidales bacterium]|nr:hypothetical protein [Candidatus Liminaster caballi]
MKTTIITTTLLALSAVGLAQNRLIEKPASSDNDQLIAQYNIDCKLAPGVETNHETSSEGIAIMHIDKQSIMANEDLSMAFECCHNTFPDGTFEYHKAAYNLTLTNNTDAAIYVDLSFCTRRPSAGDPYTYYVEDRDAEKSRYAKIAPHEKLTMSQNRWAETGDNERLETAEWFLFGNQKDDGIQPKGTQLELTRGFIKDGETRYFDTSDTPYSIAYEITYSTEENFSTYSTLSARLYIGQIIGVASVYWWASDVKDKGQLNISRALADYSQKTICGPILFARPRRAPVAEQQ